MAIVARFVMQNYMFNRHNRFNFDVVNYLIEVGFKLLFNVALCSCCINFFSSTYNLI